MKQLMYIIMTLLVVTSTMSAQSTWSVQYNMGFPHGDTKEFTDNASFRGVTVEGKEFLTDNFAIGGLIGWSVFTDDVADGQIGIGNSDAFGHEYRYTNLLPIMATASYYPTMKEGGIFKPYAQLGVGTIFKEDLIEIGTSSIYSNGWMFGLAPELGFNVTINEKLDALVSYRYTFGFETSQVSQLSYSSLNIGLAFKL